MATFVKHNLDESVIEIKKSADSREISGVSSSQLKNNFLIQASDNETKQISKNNYSNSDNISNINDNSDVEKICVRENLFVKKFNTEMVDELKNDTEIEKKINENSDKTSPVLIDQSKNNNYQARTESIVTETVVGKRKRRLSSDVCREKCFSNDTSEIIKQKKSKSTNDSYCWRCHKDIVEANCSACPRSWHRKCMGGTPPTSTTDNWICGECASILQAENATTRSPTMAHLTVDQLCMVLKYVIERMRHCPGAEPFWTAVDLEEVPNYLDYVVKPMDLALLESNVNSKLYGSTDAFMADAKWIQHNCIVFNTCGGVYADTSKLTNAAKQIIKIARQEVSEIEACPDCYARGRNLPRPHPLWFIEACRQPHPLVWAKLKGFPFWPAKALPRINGQGHVDVRFFGEHDRAWVSPKDIYLYSRDPPTPLPRKKKQDMVECMREITQHCQKLEMAFGPFQFAPPRIQYNPHDTAQIKLMFSEYDPERPYDATKKLNNRLSSPSRKLINNNLITKDSENTIIQSDNFDEPQNNNKNNLSEISEYSKQKKHFMKQPTTTKLKNDQDKSVDSSTTIDSTSKKNTAAKPKNMAVRKTLLKKFVETEKCKSLDEQLIKVVSRKVTQKNHKNHIRKVSATSTPLLTPSANGKIDKPNIKFYKPKTRIVNELNSEGHDELNVEKSSKKSTNTNEMHESRCNAESSTQLANTSNSQFSDESEGSSLKLSNSSLDSPNEKIISHVQNQSGEFICSDQPTPVIKRQGKAKKSFPNKPPQAPVRIPKKPIVDTSDTKICMQRNFNDNELNYQLPPPEAGPLCAQLNRGANELAVKMARLIEEAVQEATESRVHDLGISIDSHEATVYSLRLQMERMRWQHQQQLAELKYNTDQMLNEMRASLEVERLRAIEEIRKEAEDERMKCVAEIKSKQWCSFCGREALYYCCWNTAYCNHECQQMHWQTHMQKCSQKPITNSSTSDTLETSGAHQSQRQENKQIQTMPILVISAQHDSSNIRGA